jgi:UDPglucose 6-dehydrogenase
VNIAVIGAGHVGLVTAVCFAAAGHRVGVQDVDSDRIERLKIGETPFLEPGLDELLADAVRSQRISFFVDPAQVLPPADLVLMCVPTPNLPNGEVDLSAVVAATEVAARHAGDGAVVVNRSTSPVGTASYILSTLEERRGTDVSVAVNPEFLAEGSAVRDFLFPDRVVVGAWEESAADRVTEAYEPILIRQLPADLGIEAPWTMPSGRVPVVVTTPPTAELIKYAANAFLAVKISFINEIAQVAEEVGADVTDVSKAVGLDRRIGPQFLRAGIGWGGSCFPKDILALQGFAETRGLAARMVKAANEVNSDQQRWIVRKLHQHLKTLVGRRVALLGLAFKPNTDDLRDAPALDIAADLAKAGVRIKAFDPAVKTLPSEFEGLIELTDDPLAAAAGAEAVVLVTEWPQFAEIDLAELRRVVRGDLLLDGRNLLDPEAARAAGFTYVGVGR